MHCNVWRDKNLCSTNLCDQLLTRIIHINKIRAEKCRSTVVDTRLMLYKYMIL